jgi:hypothetical protein
MKKTLVSLPALLDSTLTPSLDPARNALLSALSALMLIPATNARKERSSDLTENVEITALMVQLKLTLSANFANLIRTVRNAVKKT